MEAGSSLSRSWTASTFRLTLSISDLLASFREAPVFLCAECPVFPLSRTLQLTEHVGNGEDRVITDPGLLTNQTVYTVPAFHTVAFLSSDLYKVFKGAIGQASLWRCEKAERKPEEKMQPCPDCKLNNWVLVYLRHLRKVLNFLSLGTNPPWGPGVRLLLYRKWSFCERIQRDLLFHLLRSLLICFTDPGGVRTAWPWTTLPHPRTSTCHTIFEMRTPLLPNFPGKRI